jgi:hypothetical protein
MIIDGGGSSNDDDKGDITIDTWLEPIRNPVSGKPTGQ